MQERAKKLWARFKANQPASTLAILLTLAVGILIGTVVSGGVKGQEKRSSDATPLSVPAPRQLSNQFSQIAKTLEPAVVNINTESTIKPSVRRRGGQNPGGGDRVRMMIRKIPSVTSSTNFSATRIMAARFVSAPSAPASLSIPKGLSSPTAM